MRRCRFEVGLGEAPWCFAATACVLASVALCGCALLQGLMTQPKPPSNACTNCPDTPSGAPVDAQPVPLRDKLGAHLLALVDDHAAGGLDRAYSYAQSKGLDLRDGRVAVQVVAASDHDVSHLERRISSVGGSVQSRFENSIFAAIPLSALGTFAIDDAVYRIDAERLAFSPQAPNDAKPQRTSEENQ